MRENRAVMNEEKMDMENLMIALLLVVILGGAGTYIYKKKKAGIKCIGCPHAGSCSGGCSTKNG